MNFLYFEVRIKFVSVYKYILAMVYIVLVVISTTKFPCFSSCESPVLKFPPKVARLRGPLYKCYLFSHRLIQGGVALLVRASV